MVQCSVVHAARHQQDVAAAQAWLDRQLGAPLVFPDLKGRRLEMESVDADKIDPSELKSRRVAVAAHPFHPDRERLARMEMAVQGTPLMTKFRVWWNNDREVRASMDYDKASSTRYIDVVTTDKGQWLLSDGGCNIAPAGDAALAGYGHTVRRDQEKRVIFAMLYGPLAHFREVQAKIPSISSPKVVSTSPMLRAVAGTSDGRYDYQLQGTWDGSTGRGEFTRITLSYTPSPNDVRYSSNEVSVRAMVPELGGQVWTRYEYDGGKGFHQFVKLLRVAAEEIPFADLTRMPSFQTPDAVRGSVTTSIRDMRDGDVLLSRDGTSVVQTPVANLPQSRAARYLKYLGWATPPLVVACVLAIYFRRRFSN